MKKIQKIQNILWWLSVTTLVLALTATTLVFALDLHIV